MMYTCPRCESKQAELTARSPIQGVWEIYQCTVCFFTWRSTEPESITNPEKYNKQFKVNPEDIPYANEVPSVPDSINDQKE